MAVVGDRSTSLGSTLAVFRGLTGALSADVRHALGIDHSAVVRLPEY